MVLNGSPIDMVKGTERIPAQLRGRWRAAELPDILCADSVYSNGPEHMLEIAMRVDAAWSL